MSHREAAKKKRRLTQLSLQFLSQQVAVHQRGQDSEKGRHLHDAGRRVTGGAAGGREAKRRGAVSIEEVDRRREENAHQVVHHLEPGNDGTLDASTSCQRGGNFRSTTILSSSG